MIRYIIAFLLLYSSLFSYTKGKLYQAYKEKDFLTVCQKGKIFYRNNLKDEKLLSLIGDACLRVDYINPLGEIVKKLVSTPHFRENASYFATILLQKKLIYQFMNDGIELKDLRLPRTSYILSIVFENLAKGNYKIIE